jgi:IS605 OrfB family transposase
MIKGKPKPKDDESKVYLKTFTIHERDKNTIRYMKKAILNYKHIENILNILLLNELKKNPFDPKESLKEKNKRFEIFNLLSNSMIMKAVISGNSGGEKTKDNIKKVNDYLKDNELFEPLKATYENVNDKALSMIITRLKKDWKNFFDNSKSWSKLVEKSGLTGKPKHPKAKKLEKVSKYSIPLDKEKFGISKNYFGVTVFKKQKKIYYKNVDYLKDKTINNLTVSLSNGEIYYNFTYVEKPIESSFKVERQTKISGGDIGLNNLLAIFTRDHNTDSIALDGGLFVSRNAYYNKKVAKLQKERSKHVIEYKFITKKNGEKVKIPIKYNAKGQHLKKNIEHIFELRDRFFDDNFNKYSKKILQYLKSNNVTDFVLSKNLSFAKTKGDINIGKVNNQKFYHIPFTKLLNLIENKASKYNINVHFTDEAYTSKASCLSDNVIELQRKRDNKEQILPTDLSGSRGKKNGKSLTRGLFKDKKHDLVFHSDINGAANHIKAEFKEIDLNIISLKSYKRKLCSPIIIKSAFQFDELLRA